MSKVEKWDSFRAESFIKTRFQPNTYYSNSLVFGVGQATCLTLLLEFCGKIWTTNPNENATEVTTSDPCITYYRTSYPLRLSIPACSLLWVDSLLEKVPMPRIRETCLELRKALSPQARVILIAESTVNHLYQFASLLGVGSNRRIEEVRISNSSSKQLVLEGYL